MSFQVCYGCHNTQRTKKKKKKDQECFGEKLVKKGVFGITKGVCIAQTSKATPSNLNFMWSIGAHFMQILLQKVTILWHSLSNYHGIHRHAPEVFKKFKKNTNNNNNKHTHTPLLVKRVNWGYLYTPIQTGTFECGYTPAYWGYTNYKCDYTPITWGYPNAPSIGDMLLNAFIWHFWSHAGNA